MTRPNPGKAVAGRRRHCSTLSQLDIEIEDAEMDIRMTYDTHSKLLLADVDPGCRELTYGFKIKSPTPSEKVQEMLRLIEKRLPHDQFTEKSGTGHRGLIHNRQEVACRKLSWRKSYISALMETLKLGSRCWLLAWR